ncbi:MAG: hypothetical protein JWO97_3888 [Acidobacteria bacterium]|nr:hypothetical protein [Acidobacteriota bacterium]
MSSAITEAHFKSGKDLDAPAALLIKLHPAKSFRSRDPSGVWQRRNGR